MKNIFWISAVLLLLAACGSDDPAPASDATAPATAVEETPVDAAADAADALSETGSSDEVLEVVDESAAEPESGEQPIVLAQLETVATPAAPREWKYKENQHYFRLVPTQPTVGGADKIEVAEFFWYGCPHCYDFDRYINAWAATKPANVRFVHVPAMWNSGLKLHAQLYYTEEVLGKNGVLKDPAAFREAVFNEYHRRGNRLATEASIQALFARFDVNADDFQRAWKSFEVSQKMRVAEDLARRYAVQNVPTVVVNGKYRTGGAEAGSFDNLIEVINELIAREGAR